MIDAYFDDPDHRESEALALAAEAAERRHAWDEARELFSEAARREEAAAFKVPESLPKLRSLFAISAVSLWLKSESWDEASRAGCSFLALPAALTPDGIREIQGLVERAWRSRELSTSLGADPDGVSGIEARLIGGAIRTGIAPTSLVTARREILVSALYRAAEWRANKNFRRAGASSFAKSFEIFEAPARSASFGVQLFITGVGQQDFLETSTPRQMVDSLLELAEAARTGALESVADDPDYFKAFARAFRDLSGDGVRVGNVELANLDRRGARLLVPLGKSERARLSATLSQRDSSRPLVFEGILKAVNLRGSEPSVVLERPEEAAIRLRIAKGEQDDTIGPKLNRAVRIVGRREVSDDGETESWADDIDLIEDGGA